MMSLLFVIACVHGGGTTSADTAAPVVPGPRLACEWSANALGMNEDPGVGFTAAEVLANTVGPRSTMLKWEWTGETTVLFGELEEDGDPSWMTAEALDSRTGEPWVAEDGEIVDVEALCPSYMSLPFAWSASTADGALSLGLSDRALVRVATRISFTVDVLHEDLGGSGMPMEVDPTEWDGVHYGVNVDVSSAGKGEDGIGGSISAYASRVYEAGEGVVEEGTQELVARWPWP